MTRLVVGIDPSTNSAGFAAFDPDTREIVHTELIVADKKASSYARIRYVSEEIAQLLEGIDPEIETHVFSENTVMRGAGGATFQRCIGAIHARVPERMTLGEVQNSTVKKHVGGHGQADKAQVAWGMAKWFGMDSARSVSETEVEWWVKQPYWFKAEGGDLTDALAIGITGWERLKDEINKR